MTDTPPRDSPNGCILPEDGVWRIVWHGEKLSYEFDREVDAWMGLREMQVAETEPLSHD